MRLNLDINKRKIHPVDLVEEVAHGHRWSFERMGDDEITVSVVGQWADYHVSFSWMEDYEALHLACSFNFRFPAQRKAAMRELISEINEKMLIGHFDFWEKTQTIMYRQALILTGGVLPCDAQLEALLANALDACEQYGSAFQMVAWSGVDVDHALRCSIFETVGNA